MMNENANQNLFRLKEKEFQQKISATTASTAEATTSTISSSSASASKKRKTVRPIAMSECNFVDVRRPNNDATIVTELPPITYKSSIFTTTTTSQARTVRRYALNKHPGLIVLANVLSLEQQLHLASLSLNEWSEPPNTTNLTAQYGRLEKLFSATTQEQKQLLEKRRWTTLGYQYDWTNRVYNEDAFVPMPRELATLARELASLAVVTSSDTNNDNDMNNDSYTRYVSEAVIINYYHADSTICGHLDDAERFFGAPIVSISLGLDCVFLIGGESKSTTPTPLLLTTGDCVIMGGASRRCYHGVPRIFADTFASRIDMQLLNDEVRKLLQSTSITTSTTLSSNTTTTSATSTMNATTTTSNAATTSALMNAVVEFLKHNRININVRQVNALDSPLIKL